MSKKFCSGCEKTPLRWDNVTGLCAVCLKKANVKARAEKRPPTTLSMHGDKATLTQVTSERVRTLADLIRVCQIDTTEWIIERWVANTWEMGAKNAEGDPESQPLYQIKATLRRNVATKAVKEELASLVEDAKQRLAALGVRSQGSPSVVSTAAKAARPDTGGKAGVAYALELALPDLHLGKLAWKPETGYSDYDVKIAERLFDAALESLLGRVQSFDFRRIIFPVGNDFLHSDTKQGTTTRGTPLDTDSRYHKAFGIGRRLIARAIDRLRALAPVTVVMVPGNHDVLSAWHLGDSLSCLYHDAKDVTIMNDPTPRKYVQFGKVGLLFTHGDKGKASDWPLLFATEQPKMFGETTFREIHVGHIHQTRTQEFHGVRVRVSPALCPPDSWHADNQFVGNKRGAECYVWHETEGLVSVMYFNVEE